VKDTGGEEDDRGFLLSRQVASTDSVFGFRLVTFAGIRLASRGKKVAAWDSRGVSRQSGM
jgi:hypothetical protein